MYERSNFQFRSACSLVKNLIWDAHKIFNQNHGDLKHRQQKLNAAVCGFFCQFLSFNKLYRVSWYAILYKAQSHMSSDSAGGSLIERAFMFNHFSLTHALL